VRPRGLADKRFESVYLFAACRPGTDQAFALALPEATTASMSLLPLPPYSPELNPVERVWLYLRERYLSHRVLDGYAAVLEAACRAWNALLGEPGRLTSLTAYPYLLRSELL
jgi:hypothetical protein